MSVPFLPPHDYRFPEPVFASCETDAPVGVSGDLDAGRLLAAYRAGVFPWFAEGGLFYWFAVSPRAVLLPQNLHVGRSLAKTLRNRAYRVTANRCFARVIAACAGKARPGQEGTWIAPEFQTAYARLHALGHAHSFECWLPDVGGRLRLAGGFYGVQIGRVFYGESMFADAPDASKIAFARAVPYLAGCGVALIDCQQDTEHLRRFGSHTVDFADFQTALRDLNEEPLWREIGGVVADTGCAGMVEAV